MVTDMMTKKKKLRFELALQDLRIFLSAKNQNCLGFQHYLVIRQNSQRNGIFSRLLTLANYDRKAIRNNGILGR